MNWIISEKKHLPEIVNFLLLEEWKNIQALSEFCYNTDFKFPNRSSVITLINFKEGIVKGIIVITSRGLLFPIILSELLYDKSQKEQLIKLLAQIRFKIHGVIGLKDSVDYLDSIIFRSIRGAINYKIMVRDSFNRFVLDETIIVKKASVNDINSLIPLEYEYQIEEVLLKPKDLNKKATYENFKQKLKKDDIYYILNGNFPISKGGTSYKSKNYTLIGGVFTWKEKRNQGYSTLLLKYLINDQLSNGLKSALFVKENNLPAIHVYESLGFKNSLDYKINYYN